MAHSPDLHAATQDFTPSAVAEHDATRSEAPLAPPGAVDSHATIPGYRIVRELGRGGMGVVYLATQDVLNRLVALKMVLSGAHASAAEKGRFLAEAEAVGAIRHPGVVQVHDFGTHEDRPYFALEYLSGDSLASKLNGTPLSPRDSASVVERVARGVQAAHDAGIIHRDLKPGNVLFDAAGEPKVTDFGLARKGDTGSGLTVTGAILGTPSYMAPEQAQGSKDVGPAADVYALGAILYECLTGRPPFRAATVLETIRQVLGDDPLPPSRLVPKLPRDLETVVLKCLSKDQARRYVSAAALADDLHMYLAGEPIAARPVSAVERGWRWVERNPLVAMVVFGVPALLAVTTVVVLVALLTVTSANVKLDAEKQTAENQRVEAERQKALAKSRLEKAVEAVDRMLVRVSGERWAMRPELQAERRQVTEDAAAFFASMTADDSADPLIRKETAKAYTRVAAVYLMTNDMAKATAAVEAAARLYDGLIADFPDDPEPHAAASEVRSLGGSAEAVGGHFERAIGELKQAVALARRAVELKPDEPRYRLAVVRASAGECFFYMHSDVARGTAMAEGILVQACELAKMSAGYEYRLELAFTLYLVGSFDLRRQDLKAAGEHYAEADGVLKSIEVIAPPTARLAERFQQTRATVTIQLGAVAFATAKTPERIAESVTLMRRGLDQLKPLLAVQPNAFPYVSTELPTLAALALASRKLMRGADADGYLRELDDLEARTLRESPNLFWIARITAGTRALELLERTKTGELDRIEIDTERLVRTNANVDDGDARYNAACVYAQAGTQTAKPDDRTKWHARAMKLLNSLVPTPYFEAPDRRNLLATDGDLNPLRQRDDFKAFAAGVANKAASKSAVGK